ncbi:hypothetical protein GUITHDRAFT_136548 [Guillardia theta CCMP2712]|uniref:Serine aminopeptidase S33 domain-containing protein n=1 Tax=Guillardia theta (strain CCMP2712) TaxID=905079 RepID=L1JK69_GUITC|nr:hypothetical protein GUITHDRAFT_136548 [Guillardia theta CCMP2712]EKX48918.1 hypothetical protein GUITHDRAFT_136548 [Guillardia theta CCMP2712]|eukprot:XP_005835898.1 hypothetical protein GUITHDRAFT_136548 [Guillardia theta CCMP2712]
MGVWDVLADTLCKPKRMVYDPDEELGPPSFAINDRVFKRQDLEIVNDRGQILACSHYVPTFLSQYPVVVYCHGTGGFRGDVEDYLCYLLPEDISVFTFDFSGAGLSDGETCSLGYFESLDLFCVIKHLQSLREHGSRYRAHACGNLQDDLSALVIDSCYSSVESVAMEVSHRYISMVPFLQLWMVEKGAAGELRATEAMRHCLDSLRSSVLSRGHFDINDVCPDKAVKKIKRTPILFLHGEQDDFIGPWNSRKLYENAQSEKHLAVFQGSHNTARPHELLVMIVNFLKKKILPSQSTDVLHGCPMCTYKLSLARKLSSGGCLAGLTPFPPTSTVHLPQGLRCHFQERAKARGHTRRQAANLVAQFMSEAIACSRILMVQRRKAPCGIYMPIRIVGELCTWSKRRIDRAGYAQTMEACLSGLKVAMDPIARSIRSNSQCRSSLFATKESCTCWAFVSLVGLTAVLNLRQRL